ncbi:LysE family translocator [Salinicola sp. LHM]|uniref:LysE family translocator n=1 Tax=unclassified Salinicola TaxID=2634022 RepID=UPI0008DD583B|nr:MULTISPECIES: LysE family translocator [unclassified Salinicola]OHZ02817.1 lysine transporter LysE [Salinicola sp. MIT1003]WQH32751.1 LysE family translocator [Salinicola sp. LHM]
MSSWLPFTLFAFVASITPGPTNLLILTQGARRGWQRALPAVFGASLAAAMIVLVVGGGLAQTLLAYPLIRQVMAIAGVAWLSWLAWKLYRSPPPTLESEASGRAPHFGALQAAGLQLVNPKTWMMAFSVVGVFTDGTTSTIHIAVLALIFGGIAVPCLACWALMGSGVGRLFRTSRQWQWFNRGLAFLLLSVAWWSVSIPG